ncbi:glycosyltransferase family 4 protein [Insolitispirillum peregrinum]|uniref:Glycosyltransferase involved in cell wall bisynthesis n=1 Tax=Insolitispirillum peregrinum TaxID=80876 RepID=A0A1N7JBP0_9PROT|nr:glycosyltransferase family 1 protein [Insolitispirillum peregrinum]SIS46694.1 Glycosyltransferase involved in cell wall bisynthesis [Insolitispirillum peregrinum]
MRIAVFVENALGSGGAFQQTLSMVRALQSLPDHSAVVLTPVAENIARLQERGIEAHLYADGPWTRFTDTLGGLMPRSAQLVRLGRRLGLKQLGQSLDLRLEALKIDIAFFNARSATPLRLARHPYVFTVWDLCHRDHPEFPEVFENREFERREQVLKAVLPKAIAVIADSGIGADKIAGWYGVDRPRVHVIPFLPSAGVRQYAAGERTSSPQAVREKYGLPADYVFYPAQMWAHKNHVYLFEALAELKARHGIRLAAALSGGDKGNKAYLQDYARQLGIADQVFFLGFVDDGEIPALYDGARALVMPSYFGPTNLPPIEAALLGCPVIYADQPTFRAQMGEAALYCDLNDPLSLAGHLHTLLDDPACAERLKAAGHALTAPLTEQLYTQKLATIFDAYALKRRRWQA